MKTENAPSISIFSRLINIIFNIKITKLFKHQNTPEEEKYAPLIRDRAEKYDDIKKYCDLVDKQCTIVRIEKRLQGTTGGFYYIYFACEGSEKPHLLGFEWDAKVPLQGIYTLILKSKNFKFEKNKKDEVIITPDESAISSKTSSVKVWHIDEWRQLGQKWLHEYEEYK
jgi:hypothetical protein